MRFFYRVLDGLRRHFHYEVRMRLFVLLFGGFLVVAEIGMISLFKQTQTAFLNEFDKRLSFTGYMVKREIESTFNELERRENLERENLLSLHKHFKALSIASEFTRIFLVDERGRILVDSHDPESYQKKIFAKEEGLEGYSLTEQVTIPLGKTRVHFLPLPTQDGVWIIGVRSDASFLSVLEGRSRYYFLMMIGGVIFGLVLVFLFLASLLKPFLRMQNAALGIGERGRGEEETAFVERTFQKVIEELRKKEEILRELYEKEQKRAQSLEDFNQAILASVSSGVIGVDRKGQITCFNRAASQILDKDGEKILGLPFRTVLGENDLARILEDAVLDRRTCSRRQVLLPEGKGWVGATSSLLQDSSNSFLGATLLFTDITRIKSLEEEVRIKENLASLGEMSAGIAHEFKNSLGTITGYIHLLQKRIKEKGGDGKEGEMVEKILNESIALNQVVNQFLDFARPPQLHLEEMDLNSLLRECSFIDTPDENKWTVKLFLEEGLPCIEGDRGLLKRALFNLIQNGKDAMSGGGTLTLGTKKKPGNMVEVSCEDTGCGIAEENLKQVFAPFFSTREEGVGLGLSLAYKIITAHRGKIGIVSKVGKGTKVTVELPVKNS